MTDQQLPETLKEQVDRNAQMRGDTVWLISPETGEEVSFAQAQTRIVEIAAHLSGLGLKEGASVAIAAPNSIGSCLMFMGAVYAGFVAVPLNLVAGPAIIGYTLRHCEAELIFVADECKEL
ncbi:MAG: long-chain fatty acid--CoA ligase, partial [Rhodobacteraceae bacterium]|nr:long-chain fatty acid--CoA ligase [Paracoccaceae bacterium]